MRTQLTKIMLIVITISFTFSTAFANCAEEILELSEDDDFDIQDFTKELVPVVVKIKAQAKAPMQFLFGPGSDDKMTDVGLTVGCIKTLPESPSAILSFLKNIGLGVASKNVKKLSKKYEDDEDDDEDDEEEEIKTVKAKKTAKSTSSSAKVPTMRIDTVKVAIKETQTDAELPALAKEFKPSELSYITKEIRRAATNNLPKSRHFIITEQGADFIIKGVVSKFRKNYTLSVEIYDAGKGTLLTSSNPVGSEKVEELLSGFYEIAPDFFKRFEGEVKRIEEELNSPRKAAPAAPPYVYVRKDGTFTDSRNGKTYKTINMPNGKVWIAENVNYKTGKSACYQNNESICQKCGRLYDWETANNVCPAGWHLPSDAEWTALEKAIGGHSTAGKILKSKSGWNDNGNGTDKYGFSAFACGYGYSGGENFSSYGLSAYFWSATENGNRLLFANSMNMDKDYDGDNFDLLSVRCIKD